MTKANEITARSPSVGADGGQQSKMYTPNEHVSDSQDFFCRPRRTDYAPIFR